MTCFLCLFGKSGLRTDEASEDELKIYAYKELCKATNYFSAANKLGEGGFGAVYRAKLRDGTEAAVKVLSNESKQGAREFLNEIKVIANVAHDNLVKLLGCCFEKDKRVLVYEYLENNSLSQRLLDNRGGNVEFNWRARTKICKDIARGLAFLHEEVKPHVVHRDIKASNILLGKNLNAKISDFGLAKLLPPELSHVSTRVAGTMGYLAPEYAVRGHLTRRADTYSFGVLVMEIISGRCNMSSKLASEDFYLIQRVWSCYKENRILEMVDPSFDGNFDPEEGRRFLKVGLLCTQEQAKLRPRMSTVIKMLTGEVDVDGENITKPGLIDDFDIMKVRSPRKEEKKLEISTSSGHDTSSQEGTTPASFAFTSTESSRRNGVS